MEAQTLDGLLAPALIPTILGINLAKSGKLEKLDFLYSTVAFGTILSASCSMLQYRLNRSIRSRLKLTLLTATLLTTSAVISIIGFSFIRANIPLKSYRLPISIRNQPKTSGADVFRYHFFADFIPGFIILLQTQLCTLIQHDLLCKAKRSFSIGEASIIAQLVSASFLTWTLITYSTFTGAGPFQINLTNEIILNIGFIILLIVFLPIYLIQHRGTRTLQKYGLITLSLLISYWRIRSLLIINNYDSNPLRWFVNYVFATHQRISLFSLWLSTLAACISFSTSWTRMVGTTNSLVRKIFHIAIGIVFISGYNQDLEFTRFAAGGILVIMLLLEIVRAWQLKPFGHYLEKVCQSLRGKWDNKYLTLSHLYLLVGTFVPLWLLPSDSKITSKLLLSTGLISVGVGDTAAAVVGTFLGKTKFKGKSGKTLEGLAGNIVAMIIFKVFWIGYVDFVSEFSFVIAAILTSLVEAITNNCDNLILPLVMILYLELF